MDNHQHEIDRLFRTRFNGHRDHSVDPSAQWGLFESQLGKGGAVASASTGSTMGLAASIAIAATSALMFSGDQSGTRLKEEGSAEVAEVGTVQLPVSEKTAAYTDGQVSEQARLGINPIEDGQTPWLAEKPQTASQAYADKSIVTTDRQTSVYQSEYYADHVANEQQIGTSFVHDQLVLMMFRPLSNVTYKQPELIMVELPVAENNAMFSRIVGFVKAGARMGVGQTNSSKQPGLFAADFIASGGVGYKVTKKLTATAEIGWMRRSGSAIERGSELNVSTLYSAISRDYSIGQRIESQELSVRKTSRATALSSIRVPVDLHYNVCSRVRINVGAYWERLVTARNENYLVYNRKDYFATQEGTNQSIAGLNPNRIGLNLGAEFDVNGTTDAFITIPTPLNSPLAKDVDAGKVLNYPLEFQIGVKYRLI